MSWKIERRASQQLLLKYKKRTALVFFFTSTNSVVPGQPKDSPAKAEDLCVLWLVFSLTLISWFFVPNGGLLNAVWTAEAYLLDRIIESTSCSLCSICCMRAWSNTSSLTDIGSRVVLFFGRCSVVLGGWSQDQVSPPEWKETSESPKN